MPTYRAIQLKGKGGLDQLQEVELPLEPPKAGQIRIRVRATGVGYTDITKRVGSYPFRPAFPFVEGYEVVGDVDAIGEGLTAFAIGQRVCALTVYGACSRANPATSSSGRSGSFSSSASFSAGHSGRRRSVAWTGHPRQRSATSSTSGIATKSKRRSPNGFGRPTTSPNSSPRGTPR